MKKIILIILAVLLIGGGIMVLKKKKMAMSKIPAMKVYQQVVTTTPIRHTNIILTLPALAEVHSDQDVILSSKLASRITSMVTGGDQVKKGQIVVTLDHVELNAKKEDIVLQILSLDAEISARQVALNTALASHKRTKTLLDARGASVEEYDSEQSKIASLNAGLQGLQAKKGILEQSQKELENLFSYAVITSPIDGIVSSTSANVGVIAMPGKPLLTIQADNGKYLLIRSADDIHPQNVLFENQSYPLVALNHTFRGLDEYRTDVKTSSSSGERLPVRLVIFQGNGSMIPPAAVLQKEAQTFCFVPDGNKPRPVPVTIVASGSEGMVVKGLDADKVIVAKPDILLKLLAGVAIHVQG